MSMCQYIFDGVDTDGTVFYTCTAHGGTMPSTAAHCDQATDSPAYVANTNPFNLMRDFEPDGGYSRMTHERETDHGVFRAVVERDDYPDAPWSDYGCPVFRMTHSAYGGSTLEDRPEYGDESWKHDGLPHSIGEVWERMAELPMPGWTDTIDHVNRYLRIFHGGSAKIISSSVHQGGYDYLVYDTRAMREHWGQTGEMLETSDPDGDEWQAYIDGDVYVVSVEQARFDEAGDIVEWETVGDGPVHGYYGDDTAAEAAMGMLEDEVDHAAQNMLPLA